MSATLSGVRDCIRCIREDIFFSDESESRVKKGLLGTFCGLLLGGATFLAFRYSLEFPLVTSAIVGGVVGLFLAIALAFNTYSRAVVCLCMPTLTLKSGRLVLSTLIFSLLLVGPIMNFSHNASDIASTYACAGELLYNETQALKNFTEAPFLKFKAQMEASVDKKEQGLKGLTDFLDFFDPKQFSLTQMKKKIQQTLENFGRKKFLESEVELPSKEELVQGIKEDIEYKIEVIDKVLLYVNRAISLSVLIIVIQSALYLKKYKQIDGDLKDNQYITELFVQVDEQRKKTGKTFLLPLTPAEKRLVTDKRQKTMSTLEQEALLTSLITTLITVVLGGLVIITGDILLYHLVLFIRKHNHFRIEIDLNWYVDVRKKFDSKRVAYVDEVSHKVIDTSHCLPTGSPPSISHNTGIGIAYAVLLLFVVLQAYMLRLRRLIASYFYPQAEKQKVRALYNKLSQERILTLRRIKDDLVEKKGKKSKKRSRQEPENSFRRCLSQVKAWTLRDKCFICQSKETLQKCDSCNQSICQECMTTLIKKSSCPCLDEREYLYGGVKGAKVKQLKRALGWTET